MQSDNFVYHEGRIMKKYRSNEAEVVKEVVQKLLSRKLIRDDFRPITGVSVAGEAGNWLFYYNNELIGKVMEDPETGLFSFVWDNKL